VFAARREGATGRQVLHIGRRARDHRQAGAH
jgi:hypothetical protein